MAPECIDSREVTAERDIWAFGMTVLVLCLFLHALPFLTLDGLIGIVYCTTSLPKFDDWNRNHASHSG